jgi:hypothetical protein
MRLWALHPCYLDPQGLVALWREALLARAVLRGRTRGYRNHPQLVRFTGQTRPRTAINAYLAAVHAEATARGYRFDKSKLTPARQAVTMIASRGQVAFELEHLRHKLEQRNPQWLDALPTSESDAMLHPLFRMVAGPVAAWERGVS